MVFYKINNFTGDVTQLAYLSTTGASPTIQKPYVSFTPEVVSYPTYSYYLGTCLGSDLTRLYSAQLWYNP
jgi:hypothetical protein